MVWGRGWMVVDWLWLLVRSWMVDRLWLLVRSWVVDWLWLLVRSRRWVVWLLLRIVGGSLIGDFGHVSIVMVRSVLHVLSSPVRKLNGVGAF